MEKLLFAVPGVVWGALIAFCGVLYSDWRNSKRTERQNKFLAEQSDRERLSALRKEVFLDVPVALLAMQTKLYSLVNFHGAAVSGADAPELADVLAKVALVSSSQTAITAERLSMAYGETYARLLVLAQPAISAYAETERHGKFKDIAIADYERVAEEYRRELESGKSDQHRVAALKISLEHAEKVMRDRRQSELDCGRKQARAAYEFLRNARDACLPLIELGIQLTVELRWEFGQTTDHEQYQREMARGRAAFLRSSELSLDELKKEIEGQTKGL